MDEPQELVWTPEMVERYWAFLATRPDVVGVALARDLESLQDRLPPFPQSEAEAVVAASLERPVAKAFATFGPAVAAASIAQVHRAETETAGERRRVAVKVLRPNVGARFRRAQFRQAADQRHIERRRGRRRVR